LARQIRESRAAETSNAKDAKKRAAETSNAKKRAAETSNAKKQKENDRRHRGGGAFLVHLHAPWGAGKTSLLNFLAAELRERDEKLGFERWVVVNFNAWRHQRIAPPWWWLMTTLYVEAVRELDQFDRWRAVRLRIHEWWWRFRGGWLGYLVLLLGLGGLVLAWRTGVLPRCRIRICGLWRQSEGF
jgi:hypothetical protein